MHFWNTMQCTPIPFAIWRSSVQLHLYPMQKCCTDVLMSGCRTNLVWKDPMALLQQENSVFFFSGGGRLLFTNPLNMSSRVQWCTCLFIRPFYGPLHVLDVAHLHNNETHLRPANNSAALHSIAKSWFPNLVQPTHHPPTRSLPCSAGN